MQIEAILNITTSQIIGAAIEVHRALGPGLLESTYAGCLKRELHERKLRFVSERSIPVVYKGTTLDLSYCVDLIVEDRVVVEVKSVATVLPVHEAQLLTYLKLTACPLGLLINFNEAKLIDGVHRLVNPA
ncbi:MAG TPA: GxxExxY protein [Vicinamibacterales bacterium]|jgi:GxxExxY protein